MSEYKDIIGTKIKNYTTNPDNADSGEVWYNETDNVLKFQFTNVTTSGSWASGSNMNQSREQLAGNGTQTAALAIGGMTSTELNNVESYNGASWTAVNNLNTARRVLASGGTTTSALAFGGNSTTAVVAITEKWNGTNWTEVNDLNTARKGISGNGTDNEAIIAVGGEAPPGSPITYTELYNGTNLT